MGAACKVFGTPITGGNVSFYNQSEGGAVFPTPTIGMVGIIEDIPQLQMSMHFKKEGDLLYLLGKVTEDFNSSAYIYSYHRVTYSPAPYLNLQEELALQHTVQSLIRKKLIQSAHDVSDGGLIISLLESAFINEIGFHINCPTHIRKDAFLYGESGGRIVVSIDPSKKNVLEANLAQSGIPYWELGVIKGETPIY